MASEKLDPVTGRMTTGHEWNGIEELDTPVPRVVLYFLAAGMLFAGIYWILMPAWPLGWTYTKGLLGADQREVVARQVDSATAARAQWTDKIMTASFSEIEADDALMAKVRETGQALFRDNCAACHGINATGGPGFPDLTAKAWLWGGNPETIAETVRVGINSTNEDTRVSQMLAFGRDEILDREKINEVVSYVESLSAPERGDAETIRAGREVFAANCVACHGEDGKGKADVGAPDLTDSHWIYGRDRQSIYTTIYAGRQGHMPFWGGRLSPLDIKVLTAYVHTLGGEAP
ncbi:cytochrome-c oxidase, cbb3-type subunit III [Pararhizobium sp. A13]|uniref:cytochrome-c oxidase, cbb3-type subunit III n=1 Tax=Pararhizobium sp. A13 TaxID=3133975 RepID=UPI00311B352E